MVNYHLFNRTFEEIEMLVVSIYEKKMGVEHINNSNSTMLNNI